jgi:hypothetical protein
MLACDSVATNTGRVLYYACYRHKEDGARHQGAEHGCLPNVPARGLDRLAWDQVVAILLDPERLSEALAAAQTEYIQADSHRLSRLATLDQAVERYRARLSRILDEELDS